MLVLHKFIEKIYTLFSIYLGSIKRNESFISSISSISSYVIYRDFFCFSLGVGRTGIYKITVKSLKYGVIL